MARRRPHVSRWVSDIRAWGSGHASASRQARQTRRSMVRLMLECRETGFSLRKTSAELNRKGLTIRAGQPWRFDYIRSAYQTLDSLRLWAFLVGTNETNVSLRRVAPRGGRLETQARHRLEQSLSRQTECRRCAGATATRPRQRHLDTSALELGARVSQTTGRHARGARDGRRQQGRPHAATTWRSHRERGHHVLELSDIPRPVIARQRR